MSSQRSRFGELPTPTIRFHCVSLTDWYRRFHSRIAIPCLTTNPDIGYTGHGSRLRRGSNVESSTIGLAQPSAAADDWTKTGLQARFDAALRILN